MEEGFEFLVLASRFLLALIFLRAGLAKILDRKDFEIALARYELLPQYLVPLVARWLPRVEIAAGVLLLLGLGLSIAGMLVASLLLAFATAISVNLVRGLAIDCGCHSSLSGSQQISWWLVARAVLLAIVALLVAVTSLSGAALEGAPEPTQRFTSEAGAALVVTSLVYFALVTAHEVRRTFAATRSLEGRTQ